MNELKGYKHALDQLTDASIAFESIARELNEVEVVNQLQRVRHWIEEQDLLVATVGEVSVGKSTFMNALLRQPVLPVAVKESTALVTYIKRGERLKAVLHIDGKLVHESYDVEEFNAYYTVNSKKWMEEEAIKEQEMSRLKRFKQIMTKKDEQGDSYIEIQADNPILQHRVQMIDTPGLNDASGIRSVMTKMFVGKADAIIMLLRADKLLSRSEAGFFEDFVLKKHLEHVFILVNRFDKLTEIDQQHVKRAAFEKFTEIGVPKENIFFVSAKQATQADAIDTYLETEAGELSSKLLRRLTDGLTSEEARNVLVEKSKTFRQDSGFETFFTKLETFLVTNKGEGRVQKVNAELNLIGERLLKVLEDTRIRLNGSRSDIAVTLEANEKERRQAIEAMKGVRKKFLGEANKEKLALIERFMELMDSIELEVNEEMKLTIVETEEGVSRLLDLRSAEMTKTVEKWVGQELPAIERKIRNLYKQEYGKKLPVAKETGFALSMVQSDFLPTVSTSSQDNTDYVAAGGAVAGVGAAALLGAGVFGAMLLAPIAAVGAVMLLGGSESSSSVKPKARLEKELSKMYVRARKELKRELDKGFDDSVDAWILQMEESLKLEYERTEQRLKQIERQMTENETSLQDELVVVEDQERMLGSRLEQIQSIKVR